MPPLVEVPCSLFGGYDSELAPPDLPEGVSPGNSDVAFLPGSVFSRPCTHKIYNALGTQTILYLKKYVQPNGAPLNLILASGGNLYVEDPVNAPGVLTVIGSTTPGLRARSVTADGREYIAISDGLHGQEVPLQYDGTYLDRVTQDGPGAPPTVASFSLPTIGMALTGAPAVLTVTECDPANPSFSGGPYSAINIFLPSTGSATPGQNITIAGSSSGAMNGTYTILSVFPGSGSSGLIVASAYFPAGTAYGLGGTGTLGSGTCMVRANNIVTVSAAGAHLLKVGYQAQITSVAAAAVGGGIASIVINNESLPGIATVTTASAHGLSPNTFVTLTGIAGTAVGGGVSSIAREGDVVTVTTSTAHGLAPGATITIAGSTASFNTTTTVAAVTSLTAFTYIQVDADGAGSGGTVTLNWPIPDSSTPNYYEVLAAPTATTFQVQVFYADGSWSGGVVSYAWNGTFFVATVPSPTMFTYQQYGPNASTASLGYITPFGQAAPGIHQLQISFLTRQGFLTRPCPPVSFVANGGQYLSVSNLPIGPPNVVARILEFTGAGGAYFFYIPVPAQANGQIVSTATQINDNSTTNVLLDFSDNTLFAAVATTIPGNNLANQVTLESALGVFSYASRLLWWGERNKIQNLLNMGFGGGYFPSNPHAPTGWTADISSSLLVAGRFSGFNWQITGTGAAQQGTISQPAFEDAYGIPILTPNTQYQFRYYAEISAAGLSGSLVAEFYSPSAGSLSIASIPAVALLTAGGFQQASFSLKTPLTIPADTVFRVYLKYVTGTIVMSELSLVFAQTPYILFARASYVNNPEGFDGVTGNIGPASDPGAVLNCFEIAEDLYLQTGSRLHRTTDSDDSEPATWGVRQVAADCGVLSPFATDTGEEWAVWGSSSGLRGFAGGEPGKLSQEIQTLWSQINPAAQQTVWVKNDPVNRRLYVGVPTGANVLPNVVWPMDYRENDLMSQIIAASPVKISFTGRMISSDLGRKWTVWNLPMACCAALYQKGADTICFGAAATGNVYYLDPAKLTDDDFGTLPWYYITYGFVNHDQEQALQVGSQRKLYKTMNLFVSGVGTIQITPLVNTLANARPARPPQTLQLAPTRDLSWGLNVAGERAFFKISGAPLAGQTDSSFNLQKLMVAMMKHPVSPGRSAI